jgi:hypothetical protein
MEGTAKTSQAAKAWLVFLAAGGEGNTVIDPFLHLLRVATPGTSGADKPFSETSGTIIDNAVIWTDRVNPQSKMSTALHRDIPGHTAWPRDHKSTKSPM